MNDAVRLRLFLGSLLVALVAAAGTWYFASRYFHGLPALTTLAHFEDEVFGVSERQPESKWGLPYIEVRFLNKNARYRYPADHPHQEAVLGLHIGDRVEVWADLNNDYVIRQLRKGDAMIVSYEESMPAMQAERWRLGLAAIVQLAIALCALFAAVTKFSFNPPG